ncbi:MAG: exostosin family protein [Anderseniella sp.]
MKENFYLFHEQKGDQLAAAGETAPAVEAYDHALSRNPQATWISAKRQRLVAGATASSKNAGLKTLNLFLPYYTPQDHERAVELQYCLNRNLDSGLFAKIIMLVDDDSIAPREDRRLSILRFDRRPTYLDWVRESRQRCPGQISVLANSDIYFDDSIGQILKIFMSEPNAFIALSRFDRTGDTLTPHANPHWSQDTWAFIPGEDDSKIHDKRFDVPLGVPRCDNKIVYVFATQGYRVFNPFPFVRSIHVHETNLRYYNKKNDRRVIGGVAMAHPGNTLLEHAKLDIEIWPERSDQATGVRLNRTLETWAREAQEAAEPRPAWIAHNEDWQYPAITERHAFHRMRGLLTDAPRVTSTVYLGFPFATLIDLHTHLGPDHHRTQTLQDALDKLTSKLKSYDRVVTVAQHIRVRECAHFFANAGVTDLFWSHCVIGKRSFPGWANMQLHPFPLFPVQQVPHRSEDFDRPRRWLFSFVGSRALDHYLTDARNLIIDLLSADARGNVVARDGWHYERVVYDTQVLGTSSPVEGELINDTHSDDFCQIMDQTTFALCPSGSGPNSIRLWESVLNGAIPVILSDTWAAPGDPALWEAATISCAETPEAISALPNQLAAIAADPARMTTMREALLTLGKRYGPDGFVADVIRVFDGDE